LNSLPIPTCFSDIDPRFRQVHFSKVGVLVISLAFPLSDCFSIRALSNGYHGQIFSSDEYFKDAKSNEFIFDSIQLDEAHRTTYRLGSSGLLFGANISCSRFLSVSDAFKQQISPIIIDNTNTTSWEMKTYVSMVNNPLFGDFESLCVSF
jgi:hypothetical protein